ncbi:Major capsid protein precursor (GpN) [Escherichia coli]|nr:Major capsid protein precursor (GpN) [Escherichia coli]
MNLVMSDNARNKLGCYMTQQASLNNIRFLRWYRDLPSIHRYNSVLKTLQRKVPNLRKELT